MSKIARAMQHEAMALQLAAARGYPPTRYSADPYDLIGYANFHHARRKHGCPPRVYLDGELIEHVRTADEHLGLVVQLVQPVAVDRETGAVITRELRGHVRVQWSPPWRGSLDA